MATPSTIWRELDNRTIASAVAYSALTSLFTIGAFFDQFVMDVQEKSGSNTPVITVYGQRVSDNVWVKISAAVTLVAGDAATTGVVDLPPGIYDNIAYKVASVGGTGIDVAFSARANADAA